MDEEEITDVERGSDGVNHEGAVMRSEFPKCPPLQIGLSPSLETRGGSRTEAETNNNKEVTARTGFDERMAEDVWEAEEANKKMDESITEYDTEYEDKLIINESFDVKDVEMDDKEEMAVRDEKQRRKIDKMAINSENVHDKVEVKEDKELQSFNKEFNGLNVVKEEYKRSNIEEEKIIIKKDTREIKEKEMHSEEENEEKEVKTNEGIRRNGKIEDDKEEGELEEGELEEDEEEEEITIKENKEEEEKKEVNKSDKEPKEETKKEKTKENSNDKTEHKEKRGKEDRKRKNKETEDERRKKKKKKHYSSEDEEGQKKKFASRDKSYDFDTLLKQEMYLVGSNTTEAAYSSEGGGSNSFPSGYSPFKGPGGEVESFESGSGEEWDGKPRRRTKRKRRSSRSPSRKNEAICMFYLQGSCKRGNECPYSHEIAPTRKMELCKFYMMDCCAKKEKCLYMHKDFPCKYFHFGMKCKAGDQCKFSHDSLQEITKNILLKHIELAPKDILGDFPRVSKHSAQTIISITEAKRKGESFEADNLEPLFVLEGKGFKYLDRILKNARKKKDGDKSGEKDKEREKDEKEKSPKKSSRSRGNDSVEPDKDKDKDREKDKDNKEKDRDKDRERDKDRDKERDRDKDRNRDRDRNRDKRRHKSKDYSSHKYRESEYSSHKHRESGRSEYPHSNSTDIREKEGYGRSYDGACTSPGAPGPGPSHNADSTKWYSSDDEGDSNNTQGFRRNPNCISPQERRQQRMENNAQDSSLQQGQFNVQSSLPDIDVMYLKNVLSAVQNQSSSQNQNFKNMNPGLDDPRSSNSWNDPRNSRFSPRDNRPVSSFMDIANDIKEVFGDSPEQDNSKKEEFSSSIDSLLQRARGRSSSYQDYREEFRERGQQNYREEFREPDGLNAPRDWNQGNSSRYPPRDGPFNSMGIRPDYLGDNDRNYSSDGGYSREMNPWENKRDFDSRLNGGGPYGNKGNLDFRERESRGDFPSTSRQNSINKRDKESLSNSLYDFDFGSMNNLNSPPEMDEDLPFQVPLDVAKEINGSFSFHSRYHLTEIDIPKPDYSKVKLKPDDPRLRKTTRSNSLDSPRSPRGQSSDTLLGSPPPPPLPANENKESRDPRKIASRDPRAESKTISRTDPRMAGRSDPRASQVRSDPRMDTRNPRLDPRDSMMDADMREVEPRMGGPMFVNGMMDGPNFPPFPNMGMPNPIMSQGIDPRGRPGILGPAPGQGPKGVPMGMPGQLNQGMGGNPFLLPQGMGGPPGPYMPGDRGDMMGGNGPFSQGQWGGGGRMNCNDPRLNRDLDMGS